MYWTKADQNRSREYTEKLIDLAEQGCIDWETIAREALNWMSEPEVKQFVLANSFLPDEDDLDEDDLDE